MKPWLLISFLTRPRVYNISTKVARRGLTRIYEKNSDYKVSFVDADGKDHSKVYEFKGSTMEDNRSAVKVTFDTGHTICTDLPKRMGGKDSAPQPVETLLAALAGCTQATAIFVGRNMPGRIIIDKLDFSISAVRDQRGALHMPIDDAPTVPSRLQVITGTIKVHTRSSISNEQLEFLKEQTELRCPVANMMIESGIHMNVEWLLAEANY